MNRYSRSRFSDFKRLKLIHIFQILILCTFTLMLSRAHAFTVGPTSWAEGRATFFVNFPISDPSPDANKFQAAFIEAMNSWNNSSTFIFDVNTSQAEDPCGPAGSDPKNGVRFTGDVCGNEFGSTVLAVTRTSFNGGGTTRTGIVFKNTINWDVFSGSSFGQTDFRRVAVHELGHALGLGHAGPDAIMRPNISALETPQADDINGVASLYDLDSDGIGFAVDNCKITSNPSQADLNSDGEGDVCDSDIDGDGVFNTATRDQLFGLDTLSGFFVAFGLDSRARAQTVTAGVAGTLDSLAVPVSCSDDSGFTVSIRSLVGENPSSTLLGSKSVANASAASRTAEGFILIDVEDLNIAVAANQRYAIVLDSASDCQWSLASPSDYVNGSARSSTQNRSSWFALNFGQGAVDLPFVVTVIPNQIDNCPRVPNVDQADSNGDGIGNACGDANDDADGDNVINGVDNCPADPNPSQDNFDSDAFGDVCDADIDNDGALNAVDSNDRNSQVCSDNDSDLCDDCSTGAFSLGNDGVDTDNDGACNIGDQDDDGDSIGDAEDNCPLLANGEQRNFDGDVFGDVCDADIDNDGALNAVDNNDQNPFSCSDNDNDLCDDCSQGMFSVSDDGLDTDGNGVCNVSDQDDDGDGILDADDNCPLSANAAQLDEDGDGEGDACMPDQDGDEELCVPVVPKTGGVALICL